MEKSVDRLHLVAERTTHGIFDQFASHDARLFVEGQHRAKSALYRQGDRANTVYFVKSGKIGLGRMTPCGKQFTSAIVGTNGIVGENAFFENAIWHNETATIVADASVYAVARATFAELVTRNAAFALNVSRLIHAQRESAVTGFIDFASLRVSSRIMNQFRHLACEHGQPVDGGTRIAIRLTHADIASLIGSTRETVSIELGHLVRDGRVARHDGFFTLLRLRQPITSSRSRDDVL